MSAELAGLEEHRLEDRAEHIRHDERVGRVRDEHVPPASICSPCVAANSVATHACVFHCSASVELSATRVRSASSVDFASANSPQKPRDSVRGNQLPRSRNAFPSRGMLTPGVESRLSAVGGEIARQGGPRAARRREDVALNGAERAAAEHLDIKEAAGL